MPKRTAPGEQQPSGDAAAATGKTRQSGTRRAPRKSVAFREGACPMDLNADQRWRMVSEAAYFNAERRGFSPGGEVADWLAAEGQVDTLLHQGA